MEDLLLIDPFEATAMVPLSLRGRTATNGDDDGALFGSVQGTAPTSPDAGALEEHARWIRLGLFAYTDDDAVEVPGQPAASPSSAAASSRSSDGVDGDEDVDADTHGASLSSTHSGDGSMSSAEDAGELSDTGSSSSYESRSSTSMPRDGRGHSHSMSTDDDLPPEGLVEATPETPFTAAAVTATVAAIMAPAISSAGWVAAAVGTARRALAGKAASVPSATPGHAAAAAARPLALNVPLSDTDLVALDVAEIQRLSGKQLNKVEERALRRLRRRVKNKLSAASSREKKRNYVSNLEETMTQIQRENEELRARVQHLETENAALRNAQPPPPADMAWTTAVLGDRGGRGSNHGHGVGGRGSSIALFALLLSFGLFLPWTVPGGESRHGGAADDGSGGLTATSGGGVGDSQPVRAGLATSRVWSYPPRFRVAPPETADANWTSVADARLDADSPVWLPSTDSVWTPAAST